MNEQMEPCRGCGSPVRMRPARGHGSLADRSDTPKMRKCTNRGCITNSPDRSLGDAP